MGSHACHEVNSKEISHLSKWSANPAPNVCVIQCVPRIDLTLSELTPEEARIRRRTVKPTQKFFNAQEIAALGKLSVTR